MYEAFFQLKQRPFAAAPRIDRYFPAPAIEAARQALTRCIERAEGAGMLVGPSGSGKTLVCHLLAEQFRQQFSVALLSNGHLTTRRELLQAILFELGLPYRRMEEGELRLSLIDHLSSEQKGNQGLLLLLDEAHTFPIRLLEEVRLITNLVRHGQPRVRLVLAGSPVLEERFASPRLEAFSQRIASRSYLEPFDYAQTRQYVISQLAAVGGDAERVFSSDALDAIHRATDGIPRLINQVCDHALMLALAGGRRQLTSAGIEEAWADLQQLPTPWNDPARAERREQPGENIIEFGGLEDEFEDAGEEAADAGPANPTVLLHRIEDHLSTLEDDFRPAATIGPQLNAATIRSALPALQPASTSDPFAEEFAEEEVLVDRYASFDLGVLDRRVQVSSAEGSELGALLEPFIQTSTPELSLLAPTESGESGHAAPAGSEYVTDLASFAAHSINTASPSTATLSSSASYLTPETGPATDAAREMFERALRGNAAAPNAEPADAALDGDLMIVEEDPAVELVVAAPRDPQARKLEYRQLFSTLRRG